MADLTETEREALRILSKIKVEPLCPSCGYREINPRSRNGWCDRCDDQHKRTLEAKRRWWNENRGSGR